MDDGDDDEKEPRNRTEFVESRKNRNAHIFHARFSTLALGVVKGKGE